jgi:hypothetical protein
MLCVDSTEPVQSLCLAAFRAFGAARHLVRLSGHTGVPMQHASSKATSLGWAIVFSLIGAALLGATYAI